MPNLSAQCGPRSQAAMNMAVVTFFLLLIVRRMPSKTEEYNKGNIFSHVNILVVYLASWRRSCSTRR